MSPLRHPVLAPHLDLGDSLVVVSAWLASPGARVVAGDRVVELHAGDVTVDVSSPATGILVERCTVEDEAVTPGQVLGIIAESA